MNKSFYGKIYAQGYEIGSDPSAIVSFYLDQWKQLGKPEPVLEPMCGTGLNLIPFLKAGAKGDGLDSSPHMLAICRKNIDALGLEGNLYQRDLEAMELLQRYGFIMIPDRSYGHIYDKKIALHCLKGLWEALLPGGWLVFDVRPPAFISEFGSHGSVDHDLITYPDGSTVFTTGYWQHLDEGRTIRKWNKMERFVNHLIVETEVFDYYERFYDQSELETEIRKAGFDEIYVTKAYELNTKPIDKDGIVFACRRA